MVDQRRRMGTGRWWTISRAARTSVRAAKLPEDAGRTLFSGSSSHFSTLLEFHDSLANAVQHDKIDAFWDTVVAARQMPLIFGNYAAFLYRGSAESVTAEGDFELAYARQAGTDLWFALARFEPDARVEYRIAVDGGEPVPDPANSLTETGGLGTNSVVRMPGYLLPRFAEAPQDIARGTLGETMTLRSRVLGYDVNYRVYTPAGYRTLEHVPVLYVTDGQDYAHPGMGALPSILDYLIAEQRIPPVMAVLIDPRDPTSGENRRVAELVPVGPDNCPFGEFVAHELVPAVDGAYRTHPSPDARALLGFSLGGMFTSYMGLSHADRFHLFAIQSPHLWHDWILDSYRASERLPLRIFVSHGTYDTPAAGPELRRVLEEKGYSLLYVETHEGHSFGHVRGVLDKMLVYFFGTK